MNRAGMFISKRYILRSQHSPISVHVFRTAVNRPTLPKRAGRCGGSSEYEGWRVFHGLVAMYALANKVG